MDQVYTVLLLAMFASAVGVAVQGLIFPNPLGRYYTPGWWAIKAANWVARDGDTRSNCLLRLLSVVCSLLCIDAR